MRIFARGTLVAALLLALGPARATEPPKAAPAAKAPAKAGEFDTPAPPFELGLFPCSGCHTAPGNPERRDLGFHDEVQPLSHGEGRWCIDCHDLANRDVLHLSNGERLPFQESYRLCGQCHGDKLRDWKVGVHGKRIGMWDGKKTYFLCVNCHNPHSPRFKGVETVMVDGQALQKPIAAPTKPEPRPRRPQEIR